MHILPVRPSTMQRAGLNLNIMKLFIKTSLFEATSKWFQNWTPQWYCSSDTVSMRNFEKFTPVGLGPFLHYLCTPTERTNPWLAKRLLLLAYSAGTKTSKLRLTPLIKQTLSYYWKTFPIYVFIFNKYLITCQWTIKSLSPFIWAFRIIDATADVHVFLK